MTNTNETTAYHTVISLSNDAYVLDVFNDKKEVVASFWSMPNESVAAFVIRIYSDVKVITKGQVNLA